MYGLIMENGVKSLGKINATTGIVTPLPTLLNLPNYIMNAATIDPLTGVYYFETMSNTGVVLMGLSLLDGSIVSSIEIPNGAFFDMFRIENDCFEAFPTRFNPAANLNTQHETPLQFGPNPFSTSIEVNLSEKPTEVKLHSALGPSFPITWAYSNALHVDFPKLESGFYWLTMESSKGTQSIKLLTLE
jgi:hypothetical protein